MKVAQPLAWIVPHFSVFVLSCIMHVARLNGSSYCLSVLPWIDLRHLADHHDGLSDPELHFWWISGRRNAAVMDPPPQNRRILEISFPPDIRLLQEFHLPWVYVSHVLISPGTLSSSGFRFPWAFVSCLSFLYILPSQDFVSSRGFVLAWVSSLSRLSSPSKVAGAPIPYSTAPLFLLLPHQLSRGWPSAEEPGRVGPRTHSTGERVTWDVITSFKHVNDVYFKVTRLNLRYWPLEWLSSHDLSR